VRPVRLRVCGDGSAVSFRIACGYWWGTYGAGQEPLGPWWCKKRENELERLASRGAKYLACEACPECTHHAIRQLLFRVYIVAEETAQTIALTHYYTLPPRGDPKICWGK